MKKLLLILCLLLLPLLPYWQVQHHEFVQLDDDLYITQNQNVCSGLNAETLRWAFRLDTVSYWHPLTWLSHMLDCQIFGLNPGAHHFTSLIIHIANTLLLFVGLRRMTATLWRSFFVAAFFALHPLNVESVVWVADRKNVLSAFFWMTTICLYARYAKAPGWIGYTGVCISMAFGLLAKPILVTLPFVLLLLDYWPLRRWKSDPAGTEDISFNKRPFPKLVFEKIPLFALSVASILISYLSSHTMGFVVSIEGVPIPLRIGNALVSYVTYIQKMFWPSDLAVFYPFPKAIPSWQLFSAALTLSGVTLLFLWLRDRAPYLLVGWLWYLGTLVPVIGLLQQGLWPAFADRFTYVPLIGLFLIIAWGCRDLAVRWGAPRILVGFCGVLVLAALITKTWTQAGRWRESVTLLQHTLHVTRDNHLAHYNLGFVLREKGDLDAASFHYSEALRIIPESSHFHNALGAVLIDQGKLDEALYHISKALELNPGFADAHLHMGNILSKKGRIEEAISHYQLAIKIRPFAEAHHNLGLTLAGLGKVEEATYHYEQALKLKPGYALVHNDLGVLLFSQGRTAEAVAHFREALRIRPDYDHARRNLNIVLGRSQ